MFFFFLNLSGLDILSSRFWKKKKKSRLVPGQPGLRADHEFSVQKLHHRLVTSRRQMTILLCRHCRESLGND